MSVTRGQLECDVTRTRDLIEKLKRQEAHILGVLGLYFPESSLLSSNESHASGGIIAEPLDSLNIGDASAAVFRDLNNPWLSLAALAGELRQRGKECSPGSIEIILKREPARFAIEKRGKRNFYRLKKSGEG